jgi:hypothetical protein
MRGATPTTEPRPDTKPTEPERVPPPIVPPDAEPLHEPGTRPGAPVEPLPGSCPIREPRQDAVVDLSRSVLFP